MEQNLAGGKKFKVFVLFFSFPTWSYELEFLMYLSSRKQITESWNYFFIFINFFFFFFFFFFRAAPEAYEGSQSRGRIRATAVASYHSHSNAGSEPNL